MDEFELTFEVPEMSGAVEDAVADSLDAVIARHHGVVTVTVLVTAPTCLAAARTAIEVLRRLGAPPRRLVDDLVTRGQIAERAGVTRQAVGQWIRGERHSGRTFPRPFVLTGGGLWLWGEVRDALVARGVELDEGISYPSRRESQLVAGMLAADGSAPSWSTGIQTARRFSVTPGTAPGTLLVPAPESVRNDFCLSA